MADNPPPSSSPPPPAAQPPAAPVKKPTTPPAPPTSTPLLACVVACALVACASVALTVIVLLRFDSTSAVNALELRVDTLTAAILQEQTRAVTAEDNLAGRYLQVASVVNSTVLNMTVRMDGAFPCPPDSTGTSVGRGCVCNTGFRPVTVTSFTAPFNILSCQAAACPANSTASTTTPGRCDCLPGFSGSVFWMSQTLTFVSSCAPVICPSFTIGVTVIQGCACNNTLGQYGPALIPASVSPFYNNTCRRYSSCFDILNQTAAPSIGRSTGVYNLVYGPTNTLLPVYCDQTTNGGGWEMVLKMASTSGALFAYTSTIWTSTTSLNPTSLDETDASALFPQYYLGNYSQVMAKFRFSNVNYSWPATRINPAIATPTYGTVSSFFNYPGGYSFMTSLNSFNLSVFAANAYNRLPYWNATATTAFPSGNLFSYQVGNNGYHDFVLNSCCGGCARWGYLQNDQNDCASNDVHSGLGISLVSLGRYESAVDMVTWGGTTRLGAANYLFASVWARRV
eukprot:m.222013 g.222013  ORF g.222013 m.222013 type:complete len:511 (-) comp15941_c0_seq1:113-1645(-)